MSLQLPYINILLYKFCPTDKQTIEIKVVYKLPEKMKRIFEFEFFLAQNNIIYPSNKVEERELQQGWNEVALSATVESGYVFGLRALRRDSNKNLKEEELMKFGGEKVEGPLEEYEAFLINLGQISFFQTIHPEEEVLGKVAFEIQIQSNSQGKSNVVVKTSVHESIAEEISYIYLFAQE